MNMDGMGTFKSKSMDATIEQKDGKTDVLSTLSKLNKECLLLKYFILPRKKIKKKM